MPKRLDITGKKFGRWTVVKFHSYDRKIGSSLWFCRCECGTLKVVTLGNLRTGKTKGCMKCSYRVGRHVEHGMSKTPTYHAWLDMMQKCYNKNNHSYPKYGGQGYRVVKRWHRFVEFYKDMGKRPEGAGLAQINRRVKWFGPKTCVWLDSTTIRRQTSGRRRDIVFEGQSWRMAEMARMFGMSRQRLYSLLKTTEIEDIVCGVRSGKYQPSKTFRKAA